MHSARELGMGTGQGGADFCPFCPRPAPQRVENFSPVVRIKKGESVAGRGRAGQGDAG
jgi:hypothetical protein